MNDKIVEIRKGDCHVSALTAGPDRTMAAAGLVVSIPVALMAGALAWYRLTHTRSTRRAGAALNAVIGIALVISAVLVYFTAGTLRERVVFALGTAGLGVFFLVYARLIAVGKALTAPFADTPASDHQLESGSTPNGSDMSA